MDTSNINTIEDLAALVVTHMASKEDLKTLATKDDVAVIKQDVDALKAGVTRVENKLSAVIDRTLPDHDRRITRVEKKLGLAKLT